MNLQPAATLRSRSVWESDVLWDEGRPVIVTIRPVRTGGANREARMVYNDIARDLREHIFDVIEGSTIGRTRAFVRQHVRGNLQMNNLGDARHTFNQDVRLADINQELIENVFENAHANGSNADLDIYHVSFSYWINPLSIQFGAGNHTNMREKNPGTCSRSWDVIAYKKIEVGCAASAIACYLGMQTDTFGKSGQNIINKQSNKKLYDEAKKIQDKCGWENIISIYQVQDFVKHYPQYRIVVVQPSFKCSENSDWKGSEYTFNDRAPKKNIIYLFYSGKQKHFVYIDTVLSFIKYYKKSNNYGWCYECSSYYDTHSQQKVCKCTGEVTEVINTKRSRPCEGCGVTYQSGSKHVCGYSRCQTCYKKFQDLYDHRCPLYLNLEALSKPFDGSINEESCEEVTNKRETDRFVQKLWVYDIESCIVLAEKQPATPYLDFEADEDNLFTLNEEEEGICPVFFETKKYEQVKTY
jgi:hypothetical protein